MFNMYRTDNPDNNIWYSRNIRLLWIKTASNKPKEPKEILVSTSKTRGSGGEGSLGVSAVGRAPASADTCF